MRQLIAFPHAQPACLACRQHTTIHLLCFVLQHGYPHEHPNHQITYTYATLVLCPACQRIQLEYCSHDCWNHPADEPWDMYWWYTLDATDTQHLISLLHRCPRPLDPACPCAIHIHLQSSLEHLTHPLRASTTPPSGNETASRIMLQFRHGVPHLVLPT